MCISLCLKTNRWLMASLATYIFKQTDFCTLGTIKRNSLSFCRYNKSLRRRHILLGPFRVLDECFI